MAMATQRFFFPQDELWNGANEITLKLLRGPDRWFLTYCIEGTLGKDPFAANDEGEDEGGDVLVENPDEVDVGAVVSSIVTELTSPKRRPTAEFEPS